MRYRTLGKTDLRVSEIGLGTMVFGAGADEATARTILDTALDAGINFFDTANIYGRSASPPQPGVSEAIIGRWLKHRPRAKVIVATKLRSPMSDDPRDQGLNRTQIRRAVEGSLRRLQTEYIDLYQTHWPDEETPLEETLRALDDLVRDGKVRALGCSNTPAWYLTRALWISDKCDLARYESLQPHYNLVHRAEFERELRALCEDQTLGVTPYSPLAGGFLTGKYRRGQSVPAGSRGAESERIRQYMSNARNNDLIDLLDDIGQAHGKSVAQTALAWLIDAPTVTAPIVGARTPEQLQASLGAVGFTLAADERQRLDALTAWQ